MAALQFEVIAFWAHTDGMETSLDDHQNRSVVFVAFSRLLFVIAAKMHGRLSINIVIVKWCDKQAPTYVSYPYHVLIIESSFPYGMKATPLLIYSGVFTSYLEIGYN